MKNADMPAAPIIDDKVSTFETEIFFGLTKREMFAMHAMSGILARNGSIEPEILAIRCTQHADALLKELDK